MLADCQARGMLQVCRSVLATRPLNMFTYDFAIACTKCRCELCQTGCFSKFIAGVQPRPALKWLFGHRTRHFRDKNDVRQGMYCCVAFVLANLLSHSMSVESQ